MRHEVPQEVLAVVDQYFINYGKRNIYDVLEKLGVSDARNKLFEYVWEVPTGAPIFTIWAEDVGVHPLNGRMFSVEGLEERSTLIGGALMSAAQLQRTNDRRRLMSKILTGQPFIAVLQTNERSIDELKRNEISKPAQRIKDSPWHVARWDEARERAILVRGEPGWAPSDAEIEQYLTHRKIVDPDKPQDLITQPRSGEGSEELLFRFPDQDHRDLVEAKSMEKMMDLFVKEGLNPQDVSKFNLGYDIDVLADDGSSVLHVEVKGTASDLPGFFLTRNEWLKAGTDPLWELAVVTNALGECQVERYVRWEVEKYFGFEPLVWRCDLRGADR
ncbi:hypothetical protein B2J86_08795 [Acidovorax sp. SRB_14]|uniref:DUF3883 domain-containing protein n=1 Tax=Acidovorax sp. SRB_14 TaxID=1962699 RepID=UPI001C205C67|nr:DUF3883 domain-containing protein [Acidovorax sp. SRB_14]NMM81017.1 hypothetical protein [Acidovorax sp. SRB_14]